MKFLDTWLRNDPNWCRAVKADGWEGLIQGAFSGGQAAPLFPEMRDHCEPALRNAREAGLITAAYTNASPWYSVDECIEWTLAAIGDELQHLSFLVVDHELQGSDVQYGGAYAGRPTDGWMDVFITKLRALGKPLIGYSGDWFNGMRKASGFKWEWPAWLDGYWHARYNGNPDLNNWPPLHPMHPKLVGKQYAGTTSVRGKSCDLNTFDDAWVQALAGAPPPIKEDTTMLLFFGREGEGGGVFDLSGNHISAARLATIRREAETRGIEVVVAEVSADDPFFTAASVAFPHGIPRN